MAKSKVVPPPPSAVTKAEAKPQDCNGDAEKVEKLKTLNNLLVKQMSDARREIRNLQSKLKGMSLDLDDTVATDLGDAVVGVVMKETLREVERKAADAVQGVRPMVEEGGKEGVREEVARVRVELEELERGKEVLRRRVGEMERERGDLERSLAAAVAEREESQKEVEERVRTVESLQKRSLDLEESLARSKADLDHAKVQTRRLEEEKIVADGKLQGFMKENEMLVANMKRDMNEVVRKKDAVEQLWKAKEVELEKDLALAKVELDHVEKEKRRVEEEKNLGDGKLKDFMQERNLAVANLMREMEEMTRKNDELEKLRKAKEFEMEEDLALAKAELDRMKMDKGRVEEEKILGDQMLKDFMQENNLVVAHLKMEMNEMTKKKDELEQMKKAKEVEMEATLSLVGVELERVKKEKRRFEEEKNLNESKLKELMQKNNLLVANLKEIDETIRKKDELEKIRQAKELEMTEALVSTKMELDRVMTEKRRVEEEKIVIDKMLNDFMQENNLVVANLKKEMDEMKRKVDELEHTRKAKELEMEEALAMAKEELGHVGMEKRRIEEEKSLCNKKFEDFVNENYLVVANLKMEMNEVTREKDELEKTRKAKVLRISELEVSNDKFFKEAQRLEGEVQLKQKEAVERESFFNMQVQEMTKGMDDLNGKLKEAVEKKDKVEDMKCNQELKILELEGETKQLKQKLLSLERSGGEHAEEISRLHAEKVELLQSVDQQNENEKCLELQLDRLQKTKDTLEKEVEHLKETVEALQKSGKDRDKEILRLQNENDTLQKSVDQHNEKEKHLELQLDVLKETNGTLNKKVEQFKDTVSLSEKSGKHQGEQIMKLQDAKDAIERNFYHQCEKERSLGLQLTGMQDAKDILEKEVKQLKNTVSSFQKMGKDQGEEILRLQDEKAVIQKSFDEQLEKGKGLEVQLIGLQERKDTLENELGQLRAVVDEHTAAEKEMESMKREIDFLKNSVEKANRKGVWAWISSATTVVAAIAYAVKNH